MFSRIYLNIIVLAILVSSLGYVLVTEGKQVRTTELERIQLSGELKIITRNTPTTYYIGPQGPTGFEYELSVAFAEHLGVTPKVIVSDEFANILPSIGNRTANVAAAGITVTVPRLNMVEFSEPYQDITQLVIYKAGNKKPRSIDDLKEKTIHVIRGSSHEELLTQLKSGYQFLNWESHDGKDITEILEKVEQGDDDRPKEREIRAMGPEHSIRQDPQNNVDQCFCSKVVADLCVDFIEDVEGLFGLCRLWESRL